MVAPKCPRDVPKLPHNLTVPLHGVNPHRWERNCRWGNKTYLGVEGNVQHPGEEGACTWKLNPGWRGRLKEEHPVTWGG